MANGRHGGASAGENTSVNGTTTTIDNRESGGGWRVAVAVAVEVRRSCYTALLLVVLGGIGGGAIYRASSISSPTNISIGVVGHLSCQSCRQTSVRARVGLRMVSRGFSRTWARGGAILSTVLVPSTVRSTVFY